MLRATAVLLGLLCTLAAAEDGGQVALRGRAASDSGVAAPALHEDAFESDDPPREDPEGGHHDEPASTSAPAAREGEAREAPERGNGAGEASTTAAPAPASAAELTDVLLRDIYRALGHSHWQWLVSLIMMIIGCALLANSLSTIRMLVIVVAFFAALFISMSQFAALWGVGTSNLAVVLVSLVLATVTAIAAYMGITGTLVIAMAGAGAWLAYALQQYAQGLIPPLAENHWVQIAWYSVFIAVCVYAYVNKMQRHPLLIFSCVLGGAMVTAAISWGFTRTYLLGFRDLEDHFWSHLTPQGGSWLDFFVLLFSFTSKDVGLFAGEFYNPVVLGIKISVDRLLGRAFWFFVSYLSYTVQYHDLSKRPGGLKAPLIGDEVRTGGGHHHRAVVG